MTTPPLISVRLLIERLNFNLVLNSECFIPALFTLLPPFILVESRGSVQA